MLKDGILQQFGHASEIYTKPGHMFVADFMGSPAMNLLSATVERSSEGLAISLPRPSGTPIIRLPVAATQEGLAPTQDARSSSASAPRP